MNGQMKIEKPKCHYCKRSATRAVCQYIEMEFPLDEKGNIDRDKGKFITDKFHPLYLCNDCRIKEPWED